jgi:hypothetical protein
MGYSTLTLSPQLVESLGLTSKERSYAESNWPSKTLESVIADWEKEAGGNVTDEAAEILIIQALAGESAAMASSHESELEVRKATGRAMMRFLQHEVRYDTVTPFEILIANELGSKPLGIRAVNRVGTATFSAGVTSITVQTASGWTDVRVSNVSSLILAAGKYTFQIAQGDKVCKTAIDIGAGQRVGVQCP